MASKTDLSGFLRYDTKNVASELKAALEKHPTEIAEARLVCRWSDAKASGEVPVAEVRSVFPKPAGVQNLMDEFEEAISVALGPSPDGKIFVLFYEVGRTNDPLIAMRRTLRPTTDTEHHDYRRIEAQLQTARDETKGAYALLRDTVNSLSITVSNLAQSNAHLASNRATASAAADAGGAGLWGMFALGLGVYLLPHVKKRLGLPEHASLDQVIDRAMKVGDAQLAAQMTRFKELEARDLPPGVAAESSDGEDDNNDETPEPASEEVTVADVISRAKQNPDFIADVIRAVKQDESLLSVAFAAVTEPA